jgi:hypothetical protein
MKPEVSLLASTTLSLEQEKNPWLAAEARFDEAATRLNLDDGLRKVLRTSAKEITVHIPVQLDDGRLEVSPATSFFGGFPAAKSDMLLEVSTLRTAALRDKTYGL